LATKTIAKARVQATDVVAVSVPETPVAADLLVTLIHRSISRSSEPAKVADIVRGIDIDVVTLGLVRWALGHNPGRFVAIDRRWDTTSRYLDRQKPMLALLDEIAARYAAPMSADQAGKDLAAVLGRQPDAMREIAAHLLSGSDHFAAFDDGTGTKVYVPSSWMLDLADEYLTEADVLFYNYLPANALEQFAKLKLDWSDPVAAASAAISAVKTNGVPVVDSRLLQALAWSHLGLDYDGIALFAAWSNSNQMTLLPDHRWTNAAGFQAICTIWRAETDRIALEPAMFEEGGTEPVPLVVADADLLEMARIVSDDVDVPVSAELVLQDVYEIGRGDRTFSTDLATVTAALHAHPESFMWVGYDRFRVPGSLPPYIGQVPESLLFPAVPLIETPEGDLLDQMLDDEGFERGLEKEVLSPLAQDVGDQEAADITTWPEGHDADAKRLRLVLKQHHKEIGTFPLCQIPPGFISREPEIVELTLIDQAGTARQVYVDYETQLIYGIGLFDIYAGIAADSGAVLYMEKTLTAGEFLFINENETDPDVYVAPERAEQLVSLTAELEVGPTKATYDIVRYVLEHSNQAMSYLALLTEVNMVRRVSRRQLASILSAWTGFVHRAGLWSFDAKKASQGFNKSKRKYMR